MQIISKAIILNEIKVISILIKEIMCNEVKKYVLRKVDQYFSVVCIVTGGSWETTKIIELTDDNVKIHGMGNQEFRNKYAEYSKYITDLNGDKTLKDPFMEVEFDSLMPLEQYRIEKAIS